MEEKEIFLAKLKMIYSPIDKLEDNGALYFIKLKNEACLVFRKSDYKLIHEGTSLRKSGNLFVLTKPTGTGAISQWGVTLIPFIYLNMDEEDTDKLWVTDKDRNMGIVATDGHVLIPCRYDYVSYYTDGFYVTEKQGLKGLLNTLGKELTKCEYIDISIINKHLFKVKTREGFWGIINKQNKFVLEPNYSELHVDENNIIHFKNEDGTGYIPLASLKQINT